MNILIVYGTSHGQTGKVVDRLVRAFREDGRQVTVWKGDELPPDVSLEHFEAFVVAGSVHFGRHQRYLERFVRANLARLNQGPSAFVSVCGALMGSWPEGPALAQRYVGRFLAETGWHPSVTRSFAGALHYRSYGLFTRWAMKLISHRTGRPTDTSRDWEFTDWEAVDRFAMTFGRGVRGIAFTVHGAGNGGSPSSRPV